MNIPEELVKDYSFGTYVKFSEKPTFLTHRYVHVRVRIRVCTRTCAYQRVRNINFMENFPYLINE